MARTTPQQWLDKWGRRLNGASADIKAGVARVKEAPGIKAAAAADLMLQRLMESVQSGKWARQVSAVSLQDWQKSMETKAIPRITQGVTQAQATKLQRITDLLSAVDAAAAAANALPKGTIEQSIQRAATFMTEMHNNAPRLKG